MKQNNQIDKIPILSFFSGGGFLDMGFDKAGFDIIFSNEIDEDFARFYREGLSSWSNTEREVTKVCDIDSLNTQEIIKMINSRSFGIIGGPPCQDFSIRGKKNGFEGIRGTLTYKYYELIKELKPTFFLMENVPGLVLLKKVKHKFNALLDLMNQEYLISRKKLNSLSYGVPQNRERLFVFGLNRDYLSEENLHNLGDKWFSWPIAKYPNAKNKYNWGEPERKLNGNKSSLPKPPRELCTESVLINKNDITKISNANEFFNLRDPLKISKIEEGDTYRQSFKRLHRKKYSPTACYGNNEVHLHPVQNRRLSVRETLRIQGVPDTYVLSTKGKLSKKFKMIGNGVPYPLANEVANSIKNFFIDINKRNGYLVKEEA